MNGCNNLTLMQGHITNITGIELAKNSCIIDGLIEALNGINNKIIYASLLISQLQ